MKLNGSDYCGCAVTSSSPNILVRGTGNGGDTYQVDHVPFGQGGDVSATASGVLYTMDAGVRRFYRLPFTWTGSGSLWWADTTAGVAVYGISASLNIVSRRDGRIHTDHEFDDVFDATKAASGFIAIDSDYASKNLLWDITSITLDPYGVNAQVHTNTISRSVRMLLADISGATGASIENSNHLLRGGTIDMGDGFVPKVPRRIRTVADGGFGHSYTFVFYSYGTYAGTPSQYKPMRVRGYVSVA